MKNTLLFIMLILAAGQLFAQNIIKVNNTNNPILSDVTTLQEAIDTAQAGDIIYLYPTAVSYGNATIDKPVTIIGPGYDVAQNAELEISTFTGNGKVDNITLNAGANGTLITGCDASRITSNNVSNIIIKRNKIRQRIWINNSSNVIVQGNYYLYSDYNAGPSAQAWCHLTVTSSSSISIRNNVFFAYSQYSYNNCSNNNANRYYDNLHVDGNSDAIIENNVFRDRCHINNSRVKNNIFLMTDQYGTCADTPISYTNSLIQYNIIVKNQTGLDATNTINVPINSLFVGYPSGSTSFDARFRLKANSPAIGAGFNGIDCGAFAGSEPYKLSGVPFIPVISEINAPSTGTTSGGLNITLKIRAEN